MIALGGVGGHKSTGALVRTIVYHGGVWALGFLMLYPLLWVAASSFKPADQIFTNVTSLVPTSFTLDNYVQGWAGFGGIAFTTFFRNSLIYAGFGTILTVCGSAVTMR